MAEGEPAERLPWDSEHFGVSIARVVAGAASDLSTAWARDHDVECLYLLADLQDAAALRAAIAAGFVLTDVRLTLERSIDAGVAHGDDDSVRRMEESDLPVLEAIADSAHVDSRFYADPRFDRVRVAALYREWLRASLRTRFADWALTAVHDGAPAGYITGRVEPDGMASVGLLGVGATARGLGLGSQLINELVREAAGAGCAQITVVTQGANVQAQRLYQRAGFRTLRAQAWFHWWA
jgi:ribosomal protein S18 acetylase RimI-like enzyme